MEMRMGLEASPTFSLPFSAASLAVLAVLFRVSLPLSAACLTSAFSALAASLAFSVTDVPPCCIHTRCGPTYHCKSKLRDGQQSKALTLKQLLPLSIKGHLAALPVLMP